METKDAPDEQEIKCSKCEKIILIKKRIKIEYYIKQVKSPK